MQVRHLLSGQPPLGRPAELPRRCCPRAQPAAQLRQLVRAGPGGGIPPVYGRRRELGGAAAQRQQRQRVGRRQPLRRERGAQQQGADSLLSARPQRRPLTVHRTKASKTHCSQRAPHCCSLHHRSSSARPTGWTSGRSSSTLPTARCETAPSQTCPARTDGPALARRQGLPRGPRRLAAGGAPSLDAGRRGEQRARGSGQVCREARCLAGVHGAGGSDPVPTPKQVYMAREVRDPLTTL